MSDNQPWHDRWITPLQPPVELLSLAEMVARIEDARLESGPATCLVCGSTATVTQTRRCNGCSKTKPISAFPRHRRMPLGRDYHCRPCKVRDVTAARTRKKLRTIRAILGERTVLTRRSA